MTIFRCGTWVYVYALANVMCLCVYVSMVCQQCMLYDDMYSHDNHLWMIIMSLGVPIKSRLGNGKHIGLSIMFHH
jgi:hypothetical protein